MRRSLDPHATLAERQGNTANFETCKQLVASYEDQGLRPVLDPLIEAVYADCPRCHAQDSDPLNIWRPVTIVPRKRVVTSRCNACGHEHERRL